MHLRNRVTWARVRDGMVLRGALALAAAVLGGLVLSTGVAKADPCPAGSSCQSAQITIPVGIVFSFTSSTTFTLQPNIKSASAVRFNLQTNAPHGYHITLAGTDPTTAGGANFPATQLSYDTLQGGAEANTSGAPNQLTNAAATFVNSTQPTASTDFTQDWTANVSPNQSPGNYLSTVSYVASTNP